MSKDEAAMSNKAGGVIRELFYLRDFWGNDEHGREQWARRGGEGEFNTKAAAMKAAKALAKRIGKGSRVQVIHALNVVAGEVTS